MLQSRLPRWRRERRSAELTVPTKQFYAVVNPNGAATSVAFEYGLSTNYGSAVLASPLPVGFQVAPVTAVLGGLTPGAQYHYRVVATNSAGASVGSDRTFTARNDDRGARPLPHGRDGRCQLLHGCLGIRSRESRRQVGNHSMTIVNPSTFGRDIITAQPVYSTQVAPASSLGCWELAIIGFCQWKCLRNVRVFFPGRTTSAWRPGEGEFAERFSVYRLQWKWREWLGLLPGPWRLQGVQPNNAFRQLLR